MKRKARRESDEVNKRVRTDEDEGGGGDGPMDSDSDDDIMDLSQKPDFNTDKEAEVGIIEKISLKNFMCHNRLDIPFGPNINFIVGGNGSGKSAVVTALVVGLGGKASVTSRGNKLKSFIKTGKQTANVEIKLRNRGCDAYKPDLYGSSIIVERKFSNDGSQYKLKSKDGKTISTKKEDLMRIIDQFNIQVDNPVAVLNQDTSRNFLNSKSPADKYKFFLKATQLEEIETDYTTANLEKDKTNDIIAKKVQTLPNLEREVLDWEQKFKSLMAIEELTNKIKRLKNELAWAFVLEKEKGLHPLEKDVRLEDKRLPRFTEKVAESKSGLEKVTARMSELTSKLNSSGEEVKTLQPEHQKAKGCLAEQKKVTRNSHMEVKRLESAIRHTSNEADSIQKRIKELQNTAQHDYNAERQARLGKIEVLEDKHTTLDAQETTTDQTLDQFRNCITKYKNDKYQLGQDDQYNKVKLDKIQRNLTTLKASQGNRLKRYGAYMPKLIQHIEEYARLGKFHKKPLGPLGANITLTDHKYALSVECCLKGLMNSFCCHDYQDEKLLERLVSDICPPHYKPTIIVSRFKERQYDVSSKRAISDQFPTILDVIQSDHPMVINTLIDQRTIECILLIDDGKEARRVMDPDKRPGPPRNAKEAFTLQGDQVYSYPTFRYYSSNQNKTKFLTSNVEEDIVTMSAELSQLQQNREKIHQQKVQLETSISQNKQQERRTETQLMKIREDKRKLSMEIGDLKNVEDPAPVDVATYEDELCVLQEQMGKQRDQLTSKQAVYEDQEGQLKALEVTFKDIEAKMRSEIENGDSIKDEVNEVMTEIERCKANKKHYDAKLKEQEKKLKEMKDKCDKLKTEIEKDIEKARQMHEERISTRRSPGNLESEINQIIRQIKNEERQRGDPEEITRQYKDKRDSYIKIKKTVQSLRKFCERLDQVLENRLQSYTTLRKYIGVRTKYFFIVMLSNRQYTGKMSFNHQKETLEMAVQPAKTTSSGEGAKDLRSLSGGERSFSTVCFILSLWDAMDSPFRCLDEFDVFMDMVNRRISMEMMMHTAKNQPDRQFIFLSPQDMSNIGVGSAKMKIFKMPNPERGQMTLDFSQQPQEEQED